MMSELIAQYLGQVPAEAVASRDGAAPHESKKNKKEIRNNLSYVTLITDDSFFQGVCALSKTIKKYNAYPLCVMADSKLSKSTLKRLEDMVDRVVLVPEIKNPYHTTNPSNHSVVSEKHSNDNGDDAVEDKECPTWLGSEFTKLNIWGLTEYEKVVYIDADAIIVDCTDELFDLDTDFAAAPDVFPPDKFNAGVLVIKPDASVLNNMIQCIHDKALTSYDGGDTGFLNAFFPHWYSSPSVSRLPFKYNAQRTMYWFTYHKRPGYWDSIGPLKIIHFSSSPKPWQESPPNGAPTNNNSKYRKGDLEWLWWQHFLGLVVD